MGQLNHPKCTAFFLMCRIDDVLSTVASITKFTNEFLFCIEKQHREWSVLLDSTGHSIAGIFFSSISFSLATLWHSSDQTRSGSLSISSVSLNGLYQTIFYEPRRHQLPSRYRETWIAWIGRQKSSRSNPTVWLIWNVEIPIRQPCAN